MRSSPSCQCLDCDDGRPRIVMHRVPPDRRLPQPLGDLKAPCYASVSHRRLLDLDAAGGTSCAVNAGRLSFSFRDLPDRHGQSRQKKKRPRRRERPDRMPRGTIEDVALEAEIGLLPNLRLFELRHRWKTLFGHPAPKSLRRNFLARAVADQMQVESYGGLSVATKRRLREIADAVRNGDANAILGSTRIKPGTQMIRQWQNATHTVTTLEGFEWNGRTYSSLSAVTNAITGTKWNGFAFFGIKRAPSGNKKAAEPRRTNSHANPDLSTVPVSKVKSARGRRNA
jgi:hypothetical protein